MGGGGEGGVTVPAGRTRVTFTGTGVVHKCPRQARQGVICRLRTVLALRTQAVHVLAEGLTTRGLGRGSAQFTKITRIAMRIVRIQSHISACLSCRTEVAIEESAQISHVACRHGGGHDCSAWTGDGRGSFFGTVVPSCTRSASCRRHELHAQGGGGGAVVPRLTRASCCRKTRRLTIGSRQTRQTIRRLGVAFGGGVRPGVALDRVDGVLGTVAPRRAQVVREIRHSAVRAVIAFRAVRARVCQVLVRVCPGGAGGHGTGPGYGEVSWSALGLHWSLRTTVTVVAGQTQTRGLRIPNAFAIVPWCA